MKFGSTFIHTLLITCILSLGNLSAQSITGKITGLSGNAVTVNLGTKDGLQKGIQGRIYRIFKFRDEIKKIVYAEIEINEVKNSECVCIIKKKLREQNITKGLLVDFQVVKRLLTGESISLEKRAYTHYAKNELGRALELYKQVLHINPFNSSAQQMIKTIEKELQTEGSQAAVSKISFWQNKAGEAADNENYGKAIQFYSNALELDPENHSLYFNRGIAYRKSAQYRKAIDDYSKSIDLNPSETAYVYRGIVYNLQEKYDKAVSDFSKAVEINPDYNDAYYHRGNAYMRAGSYDEAVRDFNRYLQMNRNAKNADKVRNLIKSMGFKPEN